MDERFVSEKFPRSSRYHAEWIIAGHENCEYPCGPDTPFEKLLAIGAKAVFLNVGFETFTFYHFLEHRVGADAAEPRFGVA